MKDQREPSFVKRQSNSGGDPNGEQIQFKAERDAKLAWSKSQQSLTLTNVSDLTFLSNLKGAVLRLKTQFFASTESIIIVGQKRQQLDKRLLMLEHEIDGLMRRKISLTLKDRGRVLDHTNMLTDKDNQIIGLEKKINNYIQRVQKGKLRQKALVDEIQHLKKKLSDWSIPNIAKKQIEKLLGVEKERDRLQAGINMLKRRMDIFAGVVSAHFAKLRQQGIAFDKEDLIGQILQSDGMQIEVVNGLLKVVSQREKVIEVPVQDKRTKQLIHSLAIQLRTLVERYPKLRTECDARLLQFVQQEIVELMDSDAFQRVVSIVKYVPDFQRVQNVYAYDSAKSRKTERQLRMLVRTLIEELQKIKHRTGSVLEIDEGVLELIRAEIMELGDVGDVLKAFHAVPKIVEVQKIVQKVVQRIIEVPQMVPIQRVVQKIVEVVRVQQIQKIVHVPVKVVEYVDRIVEKIVQVPSYTERVIEVQQIVEKIVERIVEVPKIVEVQVIIERIVEVFKPQIIDKIVYDRVTEYQQVVVIREKIVPVDCIVQRVVQVPVIREKIVERVVQVIKPFDRVVEKIVEVIKYRNAREVVNHVVDLPEVVEVIVEKLVPVIQTVQRIVEVPTMIQKIVEVVRIVDRIKEVQVLKDKIVYMDRIKEIERIVNVPLTVVQQVEKIVEKRVEVPIIQQKIVRVPEIVTKIVVEMIEIPRVIEVTKTVEKIVEVTKLVQVEKLVNVIIRKNVPVNVVVQKLVEVVRTVERIKQVRVQVEKIIEKMVEVPKVIEVERIVEKIVVVPRIIEKIVEVPQIVERIVDRIVQVERIREVQTIVQVPIIEEKDVEVQVVRNIYSPPIDRVIERIVEIIVPVQKVIENTKFIDQIIEKIVQVRVQVPKELIVERIVPLVRQVERMIQIDRPSVVYVELSVPVDRQVQKLVVLERQVQKIVQVTQYVQKIVQVRCEQVRIQQIIKIVEKPIQREIVRQIVKEVPYISENIREVKVKQMVTVPQVVTTIKEVPTIFEKVVAVTKEIVRIKQCEKLTEKAVFVPQIVQIPVEVPYIVYVNQIIQVFKDRVVEIPILQQQIKQIPTFKEKIVVKYNKTTEVREVIVYRDKAVKQQELIIKTDIRNHIQTALQVVEKVQERLIPIYSTIEKIVEVPLLLQKIVQKVVIMPQIVQVVKYVHELVQDNPLHMLADANHEQQEIKYRQLYGQVQSHFGAVLLSLRRLRAEKKELQIEIDILQNFLAQLNKIIQFPRFYPVEREVVVQKQVSKPIFLPTKDPTSLRNELAMALLVEKLVAELRSIKRINPRIRLHLDQDIQLIFFGQFFGSAEVNENLNKKLHSYQQSMQNKMSSMGINWTSDHDLMVNSILQQRFAMADMIRYANVEIEKSKMIADQRLQAYKELKQKNMLMETKLSHFQSEFIIVANNASNDSTVTTQLKRLGAALTDIKDVFQMDAKTIPVEEPVFVMGQINVNGTEQGFVRLQSAFRTIERQNEMLREKYLNLEKQVPNSQTLADKQRVINNLTKQIVELTGEISRLKSQASVNINVNTNSEQFEIRMRTLNSRIQQLESQLRAQNIESQGQIRRKQVAIKDLQDKMITLNKQKQVLAEANKVYELEKANSAKKFIPTMVPPKGKSYERTNGKEREIYKTPGDSMMTGLSFPKTQSFEAVLNSIPQQTQTNLTPKNATVQGTNMPESIPESRNKNPLNTPRHPTSLSLQADETTPGNPYSNTNNTRQLEDKDIPPGLTSRVTNAIRPEPTGRLASLLTTPDPPYIPPHPYSHYDEFGQPTAPRHNGMLSIRNHPNFMQSPNSKGQYRN